jgi:hypothetical protein
MLLTKVPTWMGVHAPPVANGKRQSNENRTEIETPSAKPSFDRRSEEDRNLGGRFCHFCHFCYCHYKK